MSLVSVAIPAYRAADLIGEALASITAQTYPHWEIVVVEDGTDDGTAEMVDALAEKWGASRVRYHRHPSNRGLSATRNTAISLAKGKYIALLDHDDIWQPHHLSVMIQALENRQADLAYAQAAFFESCSEWGHRELGVCGPNSEDLQAFPASLLRKNFIPVCSVVMRKAVWETLGGFDTNLKRVEDLDFWLRAVEAGFTFAYVPQIVGGYRQNNAAAMTSNKAEILEWHAKVLRKHQAMKAVPAPLRNRVLARAHFGVARRSWKTDLTKAWQFFIWPWRLSPVAAATEMAYFAIKTSKVS